MQKMGLTATERRVFEETLRSSHTRTIRVYVTDLEGDVTADLSDRLLDGQVIVDLDAEITRSATLSLLDPDHSLNFDTDSPDEGALYADRMLQIDYIVLVEGLGRHVTTTVFHGPITKLDRKEDVVDVEAQGKEVLSSGAIWNPITLKKGMRKTAAIRTILEERAGETAFSIPSQNVRLPKTLSFDRNSSPWQAARGIAKGMDQQLFYSGDGVATLRDWPNTPLYTFRTGRGGDVVSDVAISNLMEDVKNVVAVTGAKPKGAKSRVRAVAVAEATHPLSPARLGRNGVKRFLVEQISDDTIRSKAEAQRKANRVLADRLRQVVEVSFDTLPIPHLDPGDLVRIETDDFTTTFRLRKFTIPLGTEGAPVMPVGYHKKTTINRRRIRR